MWLSRPATKLLISCGSTSILFGFVQLRCLAVATKNSDFEEVFLEVGISLN